MRSSPRRPLILKRRKLSLPRHDAAGGADASNQSLAPVMGTMRSGEQSQAQNPGDGVLAKQSGAQGVAGPSRQVGGRTSGVPGVSQHGNTCQIGAVGPSDRSLSLQVNDRGHPADNLIQNPVAETPLTQISVDALNIPSEVKIMSHPTTPDTQLVVIPPESDVQSIIHALTARGRTSGGPNKFILISSGTTFHNQPVDQVKEEEPIHLESICSSKQPSAGSDIKVFPKAGHPEASEMDRSLSSIHWLGKMSSDGLNQCVLKEEPDDKENEEPELDFEKVSPSIAAQQTEENTETLPPQKWQVSVSERPPYSYMALIQFAINSTPGKRMTLKDIYTWIEDHFPYFKYVAKPGWKNSIRHNLSLHDMFVRETAANNKLSYWTIHPQANRCLTLDQVFKASSPVSPLCLEPEKKLIPEFTKNMQNAAAGKEKKMKPLLPRINSYLIPVHFPVTQPILLPALETFCVEPGPSDAPWSSKRVKIAPKVPLDQEECPVPVALPIKEEDEEPMLAEESSLPAMQHRPANGSRRKQQLITPRSEEPELVLPETSASDSGLDSEFSFLQETQMHDGTSQFTQEEEYSFKTPIKGKRLEPQTSSTPSKLVESCNLQPWGSETPLQRDPFLDFSPVRIPCGPALTPFKDSMGGLSFGETPFKDLPIFGSPQDFLGTLPPASPDLESMLSSTPARRPKRCSKELQVGGSANRSLLEGLVLDTKDESLSKILLDISFSSVEEDNGLCADSVWGQILSEFR
ncbi:forkhead box protein M1 [Spea bombifrons]|uniref:forkhead box protein M1 n=1 Tax=Spea bombifrons TaxID=233779 RepID=UPI002349F8D8|nr:forkhead box protein M1 [Spea bombifrons]